MYLRCQIFIIVAITYHTCANRSGSLPIVFPDSNCSCDVLHVESDSLIGDQKFTKQNGSLNGRPYYFSTEQDLISWKTSYWSYDKYNSSPDSKMFESKLTFPQKNFFSFENSCEKKSWNILAPPILLNSQCLKVTSKCSNTKKRLQI